jgi:hypothetical protein
MLTHALFIAASIISGASNTEDPDARAMPLPDATYTLVDSLRSVSLYRNDDHSYTVYDPIGPSTTATLYKLPCFAGGNTYLWKEQFPEPEPVAYGVITIQGDTAVSFTLQVVGEVGANGVATQGYQPRTTDEGALAGEFCAHKANFKQVDNTSVSMFQRKTK